MNRFNLATLLRNHRLVAGAIALVAGLVIATALYFEHGLGMRPCLLCLYQRWPYYAGVPLAALVAVFAVSERVARGGLALVGLIFLGAAGLAAYHVGVEWGVFLGPSGCGGTPAAPAAGIDAFLAQLETVRVIDCSQPAWIFLGLSMAGWNALISLALGALALASAASVEPPVALTR
ncbi:MAG: disulfide bond formation protein B [Salinarimonadaceae bacterium]|nr:MAG: disulfide bond formation protein B [Salinarimonadaceae bacterium]